MLMLPALNKCIDEQLVFNKGKSLFYQTPDEKIILKPSAKMIKFLIEKREGLQETIRALRSSPTLKRYVSEIAHKVASTFINTNQYISFREKDIQKLASLYLALLHQIEWLYQQSELTRLELEQVLKVHYLRLREFLLETNGQHLFQIYKHSPFVKSIPFSEYSGAFQMRLLGMKMEDTKEPVLDIGCGLKAGLVQYLREHGFQAYGLERVANESPYIFAAHWLDFSFSEQEWGTIISNMAFSNHFWHHHLRKDGDFQLYAQKYMEILKALKVGGSFIYAPGLPFIEGILEDSNQYTIIRSLIDSYPVKQVEQDNIDYSRMYVTRVTRSGR